MALQTAYDLPWSDPHRLGHARGPPRLTAPYTRQPPKLTGRYMNMKAQPRLAGGRRKQNDSTYLRDLPRHQPERDGSMCVWLQLVAARGVRGAVTTEQLPRNGTRV